MLLNKMLYFLNLKITLNMRDIETKVKQKKKYVFFISHSTVDIESEVKAICEIFEKCHISSFVADRDAPVGTPLPREIMQAIEASELFLVLLTENSLNSQWVNQEIGYALGKDIPVIPLKKKGINFSGLIEAAKYIKMQNNPLLTVRDIFSSLKNKQLSPTAQSTIMAFIGALELKEKYEGVKK